MELKINDKAVAWPETDIKDLLDNVKMLGMLHLEGQKGSNGFLLDGAYVALGQSTDLRTIAPGSTTVGGTLVAKTDTKMTLFEAAGIWVPSGRSGGEGFGLIYGLRVYDITEDAAIEFRPNSGSTLARTYTNDKTLYDGMLGFRYGVPLGQRGLFNLRLDFAEGGTDLTTNALAGFGYSFDDAKKYTLLGGYKYMHIETKSKFSGGDFKTITEFGGFYVAFQFGL
jgi:hypothetical protein